MARDAGVRVEGSAALVRAAAAGAPDAWDRLVDAYVGMVWVIARGCGLDEEDAADVVQTTWLRLVEHIGRLRDPARVRAWLATTARRESWRVAAQRRALVLVGDDEQVFDAVTPETDAHVDAALLRREREDEVRQAFARLPPRWQEIMAALLADPAPSYDEISAALDVPHGSIGPTRARSLRRLRELVTA